MGLFLDYNQQVIDINNESSNELYYRGYNCPKYILEHWNNCDNEYEHREVENNIAECMMIHNSEEWNKIRGGKYTRFDCNYKFPINEYIDKLPLCKCGLPCDIKKNKNYLFFRCAKKNFYDDFRDIFEIYDEPCNYYKEYMEDKILKIEYEIKLKEDNMKNNYCMIDSD